MSILGSFRCTITDARVRNAIEYVLIRIRERRPADFQRLRAKVKGFHWLPQEEARNGTRGRWKRVPITKAFRVEVEREAKALLERAYPTGVHPDRIAFLAETLIHEQCRQPGKVQLCRELADAPEFQLLATIAHELGHAAATQDDFERRDHVLGDSEWASESCADYYAYRWGFGRQVRKTNQTRDLGHHGGLPGDIIEIGNPLDGTFRRYKVTRHFYYRLLEPAESGGGSSL